MHVQLTPLTTPDTPGWLDLRVALWPDCPLDEHRAQMAQFATQPERYVQFLALGPDQTPLGLVEASLRHDHVNGTETSPVAFLEGLYVMPAARRQGVARALVAAVAAWARQRGCRELASDTELDNLASQRMHARLGFVATERVVFFNMRLDGM